MNRRRRDLLMVAISCLEQASSIIERVYDEETDSLDNIPENLQSSYRYERMEDTVNILDEAIDRSSEAIDKVMAAIIA